jgi:hypothetical protein
MSAHFAVLREAGLIASHKEGKNVVYELEMSVLESALLSFARNFGWKLGREPKVRSKLSEAQSK